MKCPHCEIAFHPQPIYVKLPKGRAGQWFGECHVCPECQRLIVVFMTADLVPKTKVEDITSMHGSNQLLVYPRTTTTRKAPAEVPDEVRQDFNEASAVLPHSARASAALSRRCLQHLLIEVAGASRKATLEEQISAVVSNGKLPSALAAELPAIRKVGNFAAHPEKNTQTGVLIEVAPGEAEWLLDILEDLFDALCVRPAVRARRLEELNAKLAEAGKQAVVPEDGHPHKAE